MNKCFLGALAICLLGLTGCRHVEDSEIVARFKAAGGGNPDAASTAQIKTWFAHHADFRKELTPLCTAKRKAASADWANTDEGKVCTGLTQANFFGKPNITSDNVPF